MIHLNSKFSGCIYELKAPVVKVGKSDQLSEIVIDNTFLSGLHATFSNVNNVPTIVDHSRHGTWVNEVRLLKDEPKKLSSHDEISFIIKSAAEAKRQIERGSKSAVDFHSFIFQMAKPSSASSFTSSGFTSGSKTLHDDYQVLSELGQGSFAVVHLAVHRVTGQRVAVKVIDRTKMKHDTTKAEVDILMSLDHPGVIKILAIYESEQEISIVMELVEGGDLFDRIDAKGRYPEEEARELFKQLCHCVNYLHSQGVAHRDLKPENILMVSPSDDTSIKLTDFGVSKMIDEGTMMQTLCGTPQYVAPEIISKPTGVRSYTKAVDLWSMGVILFTLLAGFTP
ncbi:MAG: serine/threonine-protein kinase, partial [archaeon]|nr:serine/threonine-protein kinase [archaeon]